jgi:hypothetical protein
VSTTSPTLHLPTTIAFTFVDRSRDEANAHPGRRLAFEPVSEPSVDVVVGRASSVQRAFATRPAHPARVAVIVGGGFVDCASCTVHVDDERAASRVARLLASLTSPRSWRIASLDGADLRAAVIDGGIAGLVQRHHARTMEEAMKGFRTSLDGRRLRSACIVFDLGHSADCLHEADLALHEVIDDDATMACALRPPRCRGALPGFTIFASA